MIVWVFIVSLYYTLSALYATSSTIFVATGLYEPRDWPALFGSPLNACMVRRHCGYVCPMFPVPHSRVWHQLHRRALTSNANFLASAFHIPRGTLATYFKLFASFLVSGLAHAAGDSTGISLKGKPFDFSFSKLLPLRLKTRLLLLPHAWNITNARSRLE